MKGIILAAGRGTRMYPLTKPVCKPLLPVFDKPMIYYPLSVLMRTGIRDVLIIVPNGDFEPFENLLGDGSQLGIHITYRDQKVQQGIADAFRIGKDFIAGEPVCLALGDNIFYGPAFRRKLREARAQVEQKGGAVIFGYRVADPSAFGVVEFDQEGRAVSIEEKPEHPRSHYAVPGLYFYDEKVAEIAAEIKPSERGELEITDVNNIYLARNDLHVITLGKELSWFDAGDADSLFTVSGKVREAERSGKIIGCPEESAFRNGWITADQVEEIASGMANTQYGQYLFALAEGLE